MIDSPTTQGRLSRLLKRVFILNQFTVVLLVLVLLALVSASIYYSQMIVDRNASHETGPKEQVEVDKLAAEVRQIRSDTSGSLFWLKLVALFVTVGGAVGGYLVGQSQNSRRRMAFEHRKDVDASYQLVVQGLSDQSSVMRATAAVKLGAILKSFPKEWDIDEDRQQQLVRLTKEVLAAALAIEADPKVLKTLSIALVLHKPFQSDPTQQDPQPDKTKYGDARELDLSGAKANYAYWSKVDFSGTDFYNAQLAGCSLRNSTLNYVQFYFTDLSKAVLSGARGDDTSFKLADLRDANLTEVRLVRPNFEGARVHGVILTGASLEDAPLDGNVDNSAEGNGSQMISIKEWLAKSHTS